MGIDETIPSKGGDSCTGWNNMLQPYFVYSKHLWFKDTERLKEELSIYMRSAWTVFVFFPLLTKILLFSYHLPGDGHSQNNRNWKNRALPDAVGREARLHCWERWVPCKGSWEDAGRFPQPWYPETAISCPLTSHICSWKNRRSFSISSAISAPLISVRIIPWSLACSFFSFSILVLRVGKKKKSKDGSRCCSAWNWTPNRLAVISWPSLSGAVVSCLNSRERHLLIKTPSLSFLSVAYLINKSFPSTRVKKGQRLPAQSLSFPSFCLQKGCMRDTLPVSCSSSFLSNPLKQLHLSLGEDLLAAVWTVFTTVEAD